MATATAMSTAPTQSGKVLESTLQKSIYLAYIQVSNRSKRHNCQHYTTHYALRTTHDKTLLDHYNRHGTPSWIVSHPFVDNGTPLRPSQLSL